LEPAAEIAEFARARGLEVHASTLEEHLEAEGRRPNYSAMTLLNVLEHLPDPVGLLNRIREALPAGGLLAIRAPNDYNELQLSAQKALGKDPWWIAIPDHVNYFDRRVRAGGLPHGALPSPRSGLRGQPHDRSAMP
jgi:trans-aconitate methyltransferase